MRIRIVEDENRKSFDGHNRFTDRPQLPARVRNWPLRTIGVRSTELAGILSARNQEIGNPHGAELAKHLSDPQTLVLVGGQQPMAFGGPLMVYAKMAGLINLAAELEVATDRRVVPIFWVHSEDHDLIEVNQYRFREGFEWRHQSLPLRPSGLALESVRLDQSAVSAAAHHLQQMQLGGWRGLLPLIGEAWASWSTRCLQTLAGDPKVVFFEPHWVRHLAGEFFEQCVSRAKRIDEAFAEGTRSHESAGFPAQLQLQENGQLFRLSEDGRRTRLLREGETWSLVDSGGVTVSWTQATLQAEALTRPVSFSTNAVTRPLLQQWLFDPIAQVSGPAESSYLKQIEPVFQVLGLTFPVIWPRPRIIVIPESLQRKASQLGMELDDLLRAREEWPQDQTVIPLDSDLQRLQEKLKAELMQIASSAGARGNVAAALKRLREDLEDRFNAHRSRIKHRWLQSIELDRGQRRGIAEFLYPTGKSQERVLSPLDVFRSGGLKRWPDLLAAIDPYEFHLQVLQ